MSLRFVEIDEILTIHTLIITRAKTKASVRDFSLLHSAVERPKATFQGKDLYPTLFAKAAALLQSLCMNHPFTDGNKRSAWATTHKFLFDNGYMLRTRGSEAAEFMIMVDNEKLKLATIASWLKTHSIKVSQEIANQG